jgi:hypothetical protein
MLNVALATSPATIVCPYDTRSVPASVIVDVRCTHPEVLVGTTSTTCADYRPPESFLLER